MKDKNTDTIACFDTYVKTSLRNCLYDIRLKNKKSNMYEVLMDIETLGITTEDKYNIEENYVKVLDFDMMIKNDLLYEVLESLEKHQRDIIYLSTCEKWSDAKIGKLINMSQSNVQRIKTKVIKQIRKIMIGDDSNEK